MVAFGCLVLRRGSGLVATAVVFVTTDVGSGLTNTTRGGRLSGLRSRVRDGLWPWATAVGPRCLVRLVGPPPRLHAAIDWVPGSVLGSRSPASDSVSCRWPYPQEKTFKVSRATKQRDEKSCSYKLHLRVIMFCSVRRCWFGRRWLVLLARDAGRNRSVGARFGCRCPACPACVKLNWEHTIVTKRSRG